MDEFYTRFGESVKKYRRLNKLNQEELAEQTEMGRATIASIERGRQAVTLLQAIRLSSVLGVELSKLVTDAQSAALRIPRDALDERDFRIVQQLHDELQ